MKLFQVTAYYITLSLLLSASFASFDDDDSFEHAADYDFLFMTKIVQLELGMIKVNDKQAAMEDALTEAGVMLQDAKKEQTILKTALENAMLKLEQNGQPTTSKQMNSGSGSTFIRWGRSRCPGNGTELIYMGIAGGSFYQRSGGAANYLCLTKEPLWNTHDDEVQPSSTVYGAVYGETNRDSSSFLGTSQVSNQVVLCAACLTQRSSIIMIPGRNRCYDGWTLEYHGYLAGGNDAHYAASEYICLDERPSFEPGRTSGDGKLVYISEGRCEGSLPCPPYVDGRELTCVVCSK